MGTREVPGSNPGGVTYRRFHGLVGYDARLTRIILHTDDFIAFHSVII